MMKKSLISIVVITLFLLPLYLEAQVRPKKVVKPYLLKMPDLKARIGCPSFAYPGQELKGRVKVKISNTGAATASSFAVDLVLSSDTAVPVKYAIYSSNFHEDVLLKGGREFVKYLLPGKSMALTLNGTNKIPSDTPAGTYYLGVVVDPGNKVKEYNETNNVALCKIEVKPLPDLIVTGFAHTGGPPGHPPECRLLVTIRNVGQGRVPLGTGAKLNVYVNNVLVDSIDLDSSSVEQTIYHDFHNPYDPSNPEKSRSIVGTSYIFPPAGGSFTVRAVIDVGNKIKETNEGNNSFERVEVVPAH